MNTQEQLEELVTKLKALRQREKVDSMLREIKAFSYEDRVRIFQALVEDLGGSR